MLAYADAGYWAKWVQIVLIDLLLAGDNALVIALAVRSLDKRGQFLGRLWGTFGAVALRFLFIFLASTLLQIPLVQAAGGVVLLWIAWKLLAPPSHGVVSQGPAVSEAASAAVFGESQGKAPPPPAPKVRAGSNVAEAIKIIVIADVSMSFDNAVAIAAAADGDMLLVVFGIALTIPLVVFGSTLMGLLIDRFPFVVWLGGGVLGYVAGKLLVEDVKVQQWLGAVEQPALHPVPIGLGVLLCAVGWWRARRARLADANADAGADADARTAAD